MFRIPPFRCEHHKNVHWNNLTPRDNEDEKRVEKRARSAHNKKNMKSRVHIKFSLPNWKTLITLLLNTMFGNLLRILCAWARQRPQRRWLSTAKTIIVSMRHRLHSDGSAGSAPPFTTVTRAKFWKLERKREKLENFVWIFKYISFN